ncbi:1,4-dihydroxy-6-naphtoate synthase [Virgisporangium aliadipatigenens]|uniref:1,4-dihydroxy-6-naphtoate synthase n=1 Tax=Virgisporangium aliadipatigenens TaxID=741659 RepID=A0A8J4DPG9_9ACTN|nr:1,4-dihydroxy-6-naphthoate synthase [Virgisporangium aliadipatigenens]GIJ44427.1 1,4-dihydroxy-6-naphtoate synthase [Virgisporangium aliadipatigenens]
MNLTISPCPNDTFAYHALVHGLVSGAPQVTAHYADVDVTNNLALTADLDVVKVSYAALPWLLDRYQLLPCGGALGRGCGPLVVTASEVTSLEGLRVAVPGDRTTAYLLMRLWAASGGGTPASVEVVPFAAIMPAVAAGRYDAGLVIHEARFTFERHGLRALVDLGEWWERDTGLPIPLGAILMRRGFGERDRVAGWVRASVEAAFRDPAASQNYVLAHAQEMEPAVVAQHIALYVNDFTLDLGAEGYGAVEALLGRAAKEGLVPALPAGALS